MKKLAKAMKMVVTCRLKDHLSLAMLDAARTTLEFYSPTEWSSSAAESETFAITDAKEVYHDLSDLISPPAEVFIKVYFFMTMFHIRVLREVVELFGFNEVPTGFIAVKGINEEDK